METIRRNQVLDELDIRTLPDGRKRIFSIKFVTFLLPNYRPGQVPSGSMNGNENLDAAAPSTAMPTMASQPAQRTNISQAAYRYALRRERD